MERKVAASQEPEVREQYAQRLQASAAATGGAWRCVWPLGGSPPICCLPRVGCIRERRGQAGQVRVGEERPGGGPTAGPGPRGGYCKEPP